MEDANTLLTRHKLDVESYYGMAEAGILGRHERVELIDGELIDMAPIGQNHGSTVSRLHETLVLACAGRATVCSQTSLRLDRFNVPEPDFAILKRRADFYGTGEPAGPADVLFLIEVADSSLRFDRTVKLPLYARSGIPEVWIIDLKQGLLECHRQPVGSQYTHSSTHRSGDTLNLAAAPDISLRVDQVFG